jgi:hypothetical protein
MDRVYHKLIWPALEEILLAPKERSSLNDRVEMIFKHAFNIRENEFPKAAVADWQEIERWRSQGRERIDSQYENGLAADKGHALALSLKPTECKKVLRCFLKIAQEVSKRKG